MLAKADRHVPAYIAAQGFTKILYEYSPSNAPMAGLDLNFGQRTGHAWYPYAWWSPNHEAQQPENFRYDPADGALVMTPSPGQASVTIESFTDVRYPEYGAFYRYYAFELDWHPNNGSGFWSMSKHHVTGGEIIPDQPLTYVSEMDWVECVSTNGASDRVYIPSALHLNTSGFGGVADRFNFGDIGGWAKCPGGQAFNGARHILGGTWVRGAYRVYVDGTQVNSFTGAHYYPSADQLMGLFIDYADNYLRKQNTNPDPRELRVYRLTIYQ